MRQSSSVLFFLLRVFLRVNSFLLLKHLADVVEYMYMWVHRLSMYVYTSTFVFVTQGSEQGGEPNVL